MAFCYENILSRPLPGIIISFLQKLLSAYHFDPAAVKDGRLKNWPWFPIWAMKTSEKALGRLLPVLPMTLVYSAGWISFLSLFCFYLFLFAFVFLSLLFCSCFSTAGRNWEIRLSDLRKGVAETESIGLQRPDFIRSRKPMANVHGPERGNRRALWGVFSSHPVRDPGLSLGKEKTTWQL